MAFENKKISLISLSHHHSPNKPLQLWSTHSLLSTCQHQVLREVYGWHKEQGGYLALLECMGYRQKFTANTPTIRQLHMVMRGRKEWTELWDRDNIRAEETVPDRVFRGGHSESLRLKLRPEIWEQTLTRKRGQHFLQGNELSSERKTVSLNTRIKRELTWDEAEEVGRDCIM